MRRAGLSRLHQLFCRLSQELLKNLPHVLTKKSVQFFIAISGAVMSFGCLAGGSWPGGLDQLVTLESGPSQPQSVHRSP